MGLIYRNGVLYGAGTSNDFTTAEKTKLAGIETGAQANVQADWGQTVETANDFIKNKPTIPSSLSDLSNDTGFITNTVADLINYYQKTETYSQSEIDELITAIPKFKIKVVDSLLIQEPDVTTIYLLTTGEETNNLYTEYIYVYDEELESGSFERLGTQTLDLSGYYTSTQIDTLLAAKGGSLSYNASTGALELKTGDTVLSTVTIEQGTMNVATYSTPGLVKPDGTSITISSDGTLHAIAGTGGVKIGDVTGPNVTVTREVVTVYWTDPVDLVLSGTTLATWAGTKVVVKSGSAPVNSTDGALVVDSTTRDQYASSSTALTYNEALYDNTWYFRFFPYTTDGVETAGTAISVTPTREVIATIPTQNGALTYDSTEQTAQFNNYDTDKMTATGITGTEAGSYTAQFLPNHDYMWSDSTITAKSVDWEIDTAILAIPSVTSSHTYDTTEQTVTVSEFDDRLVTQSGNNKGTDAGDYTLTFTLNNTSSSKWEDNTTVSKGIVWNIAKASAFATFNPTEITLDGDNLSGSASLISSSGEVSIQSYDTNLITPSYTDGALSVNSPNQVSGDGVITFTVGSSDNYNAGAVLFTVHCNFLALVDWKNGSNCGTDEEIVAMIEAADAGTIDLTDYWSVGDERTVTLFEDSTSRTSSGTNSYGSWSVGETHVQQTQTLVLMDTNHYDLVETVKDTSGADRTKCSFVVGLKNCLANGTSGERGYMNSSSTNSGSWNGCARRSWCNSAFVAAIPSTLRSAFKKFKTGTIAQYNGSSMQYSEDWFALFAEREIFDSRSYSNQTEWNNLSQIEWYKTSTNRVKKQGDSGSASSWWERSPCYSSAPDFCRVLSDGSADWYRASYGPGLAPFGCI